MADKNSRTPPPAAVGEDWNKREKPGRFLRDVSIVALVLAGAFGLYWYKTDQAHKANQTAKEGKDLLVRDNPKDLLAAEAKLKEVLAKYDDAHGYSLATLGEINAVLWADHHIEARKAEAESFVARAWKENPGIAEQFAAKAYLEIEQGKAAEVEGWLKKDVLDKNAGAGRVFNAYGRAQRAQGKLDAARQSLKGAFDADWRNPRFAMDAADVYLEDGDTLNAATFYNKGLSANADHLGCRIGFARTRIMRMEGLKDASDTLEEILGKPEAELTPNLKARALVARAELRLYEQKSVEALADANAAVAADGKYAPAYVAKGLALARTKDASAAAEFDRAIAADAFVASFYFDAAHALLDGGVAQEKALAYFEKFPLPKDDRYHLRYGDALRKLGKLSEAVAAYDASIKENPLNAPAHFQRSVALWGKKLDADAKKLDAEAKTNAEEAMKSVQVALGVQEMFPDAQIHKGDMLFADKKYQDALQDYFLALQHLRALKAPRERLNGLFEKIKGDLAKAKEKELGKVWETEAGAAIQ